MKMLSRGALAGIVAVLTACSAAKEQPEILGVDYETRVSSAIDSDGTASAAIDETAQGSAPGSAPAMEGQSILRVVDVRRASNGDGARIVAQLSRTPGGVRPFELKDPRRCVVDVDGPAIASKSQQVVPTGDAMAPRLRIGSYPDRLRLVVELESGVTAPCESRLEGSAVVMGVGPRPTGAAPAILWTAPTPPTGAEAHAAWALAQATGDSPTAAQATSAAAASARAETERAAAAPDPKGPRVASAPPAPEPPPPPPPPPPPVPVPTPGRSSASADAARSASRAAAARAAAEAAAQAAAPPDAPAPRAPGARKYTGRRISLEFKDADILNVLRIIADVAQKNIVATDDVKGRVTIVLHDVPWDQALDILLRSTGLEQVEFDDVITVSTSKRLEEERKGRLAAFQAGQELEPLRTEYIRVNYVKAAELANILQGGITTSGAAAVAAAQIGNQGVLGGAPLGDSAAQRRGLLSSRGSVQIEDKSNTLIVRDIADGIANAIELVRRLDVQTPQVAIQGLIFEGDTNLDRSLGVRWGATYRASPETGNPTGRDFPGRVIVGGAGPNQPVDPGGVARPILVDFPAAGIAPGSGSTLGLLLGSLSGVGDVDAQITALEQAGKGKVISRPKVITLNNSEATIQSLEILRVRLPSTGTVINTGAGGVAGGQTVATQAIDTGIILRVTPQVSSDGYVLMQLFVKSSVPSDISTDDIPNEISRQATSQVLVREGETVVIGGVYRQRANKAESGIPWLMNVPVLGWMFKSTLDRDNRQELLVFITPRVVWRTGRDEGKLPTATELWESRALSAYQLDPSNALMPPGGGVQPVSLPPEG